MTRRDDDVMEQIRRDADRDAREYPAPEPTVEQMRRVGQAWPAARPARDRKRGAA